MKFFQMFGGQLSSLASRYGLPPFKSTHPKRPQWTQYGSAFPNLYLLPIGTVHAFVPNGLLARKCRIF